jgi:hypothetical protein
VPAFIEWLDFKILDWVWGNGESTAKLMRATIILWIVIAIVDVIFYRDSGALSSYKDAFFEAPQIFFGVISPQAYPKWYLTAIVVARLVAFGFFMSIIIKRFNRR